MLHLSHIDFLTAKMFTSFQEDFLLRVMIANAPYSFCCVGLFGCLLDCVVAIDYCCIAKG